MNFKKIKKKKVHKKVQSEWCHGAGSWIDIDKKPLVQTRKGVILRNTRISKKRCVVCNKRLQPKPIFDSWNHGEFHGWRIPKHKAK
jgi:hypothetical protein